MSERSHEARSIESWEERYGSEPVRVLGRIRIPYRWHVGATASRFFRELRDHRRITGRRCDACAKVFVPPRASCPFCYRATTTEVEVGSRGTLETFTVDRRGSEVRAFGLIRLDGADTLLAHRVTPEVDLVVGARVEAVFEETRRGSVLDIREFKRVQS